MATLNISSISSGQYSDMVNSVASTSSNKVLLDNISNYYNYKDIIHFPMSFLRKYENILKSNLMDYKITKSRFYRPEYVSWDVYGTTDLWYLVLFVNDLTNPMELNFEDIKLPNSYYIMEIINKLKMIDNINNDKRNPTNLVQSLIKDINSSSNKIFKDTEVSNAFVPDPTLYWKDDTELFDGTYLKIQFGELERDYYKCKDTNQIKQSHNNFGFIPNLEMYKVLSTKYRDNPYMVLTKNFDSNTKYYIMKRYAGIMNLNITSKSDEGLKYKYNKNILVNSKVDMAPTILTYDLREACIAPEYLTECLVLKFEDKVYEPEILKDDNGKEYYGITIDDHDFEILYDGTAYYIEYENTEDERSIILLENKDDACIFHSANEWKLNDSESPLIRLDELSENLYFNEEYLYKNGEYVYNLKYTNSNLDNLNNIRYRIDVDRDLKSNSNKLSKYEFLGVEFEVGISYTNSNIDDLKKIISFSPLSITVVLEDLNDDGKNIEYTFSYPYGINDIDVDTSHPAHNYLNDYIDEVNNSEYNQTSLYKYKKIIPIIKNFRDKEHLKIKKLLIGPHVERTSDDGFMGELIISCGKIKLFGLQYEDIITEFMTPEATVENMDFDITYNYTTTGTKYSDPKETTYFEPYIVPDVDDIMYLLSDENNLDHNKYSNLIMNEMLTENIHSEHLEDKDEKENDNDNSIDKFIGYDFYTENTSDRHIDNKYSYNDYITARLYNADNTKFNLADNYKLDIKLIFDEESYKNNKKYLNGYNIDETDNKHFFHNNIQFLFNIVDKNNYYLLNFGEYKYLTNNSSRKNDPDSKYHNNNTFLSNFNSYPIEIDLKENKVDYIKFRNMFVNENNTIERHIIYTKVDNMVYSMPGGLYKSIYGEGTRKYSPYSYIKNFYFSCYPIDQSNVLSNYYHDMIQYNTISLNTSNEITMPKRNIYLSIRKSHSNFNIYYKLTKKDNYKLLYSFSDSYKPFSNGTIGFNFINNLPFNKLEILSYKVNK